MINPINEPPTLMMYLQEIAKTSLRHWRALILTLACVIMLGTLAFFAFSMEPVVILPFAIAAIIIFETTSAAWRLHRGQNIALATLRKLLDMDTADRALFERHLKETHRWREERLHARNADRLQQLIDEIELLQSEVHRLSLHATV